MLRVHSLETFGTQEGPGIRLLVFLQGCNWRCLYCHNPDTQKVGGGQLLSAAKLIKLAEQQKEYAGGTPSLTVSGGEPTLQAKELIKLFQLGKRRGVHLALDTNGGIDTPEVRKLYDLTDLVLLDIKQINAERHKLLTGASNASPLALAAYREASAKPFWIRYVLVPGYSDAPEDLEAFAKHFSKYQHLERIEILPYHDFARAKYEELGGCYPLEGSSPATPEQAEKARGIMAKYLKKVIVR